MPHFFTWFNESLEIVTTGIIVRLPFLGMISPLVDRIDRLFMRFTVAFLRLIGIARYNNDPASVVVERGKVLWQEALRRGIPMKSVQVLDREIDMYRAKVGGKTVFWSGLPRPVARARSGVIWMDDKHRLKRRLESAGIPVPRGGSFWRLSAALRHFETLEKPVIVKPRLGSRGRHTTTFVRDEGHFRDAWRIAKKLCHWAIVEEHLVGSVYRGTVIDGRLVGVLGGSPPRVTGDGKSTVRELIALKNASRPEGVSEFVITAATPRFLARVGYLLDDVLPAGVTIDLTEKIGVAYGGTSFDATDETHLDTKVIIEEAAHVVDDPIMGFDFIVPDISLPPHGQKWGIIECNGLPFINLHHDPLIGAPRNAAGHVWDLMGAKDANF